MIFFGRKKNAFGSLLKNIKKLGENKILAVFHRADHLKKNCL
jgi:hypothetical protein